MIAALALLALAPPLAWCLSAVEGPRRPPHQIVACDGAAFLALAPLVALAAYAAERSAA